MGSSEFEEWRSTAPTPYLPTNATLSVPLAAVETTFRLLVSGGPLESCVFWYGPRDGANGRVDVVRAPAQHSTRFNYQVDEEAVRRMVMSVPDGMRPLAQVHSHPGDGVEHSRYDDRMAISRRALSLVFPRYGRDTSAWLDRVGVHEWQNGYWHLLEAPIASRRVSVVDGLVDVEDHR